MHEPMKFFFFLQFMISVYCAEEEKQENIVFPFVYTLQEQFTPGIIKIIVSYYSDSELEHSILISPNPITYLNGIEASSFLIATGSVIYMPFLELESYSGNIAHDLDAAFCEAARNDHFVMIFNIISSKIIRKEDVMRSIIRDCSLNIFKRFLPLFTDEEILKKIDSWYYESSSNDDPNIFIFIFENQDKFPLDYSNLDFYFIYGSVQVAKYLLEKYSFSQKIIKRRLNWTQKYSYEFTKYLFGMIEGDKIEFWKQMFNSRKNYMVHKLESVLELTKYCIEDLNEYDLAFENFFKFLHKFLYVQSYDEIVFIKFLKNCPEYFLNQEFIGQLDGIIRNRFPERHDLTNLLDKLWDRLLL